MMKWTNKPASKFEGRKGIFTKQEGTAFGADLACTPHPEHRVVPAATVHEACEGHPPPRPSRASHQESDVSRNQLLRTD